MGTIIVRHCHVLTLHRRFNHPCTGVIALAEAQILEERTTLLSDNFWLGNAKGTLRALICSNSTEIGIN